jgi:hypothetical protein
MKILFSPSESKEENSPLNPLEKRDFLFPELFEKRLFIVEKYLHFIHNASFQELQTLFGIKNKNECEKLRLLDALHVKTQKAVLRYNGVAYEYLDYSSLHVKEQTFIDENVIIFSNLFGPLLAKDKIPYYKLKQGSSLGEFKIEKFYKEYFSKALDDFLKDEFILDLRAGFYEKFYALKQPFITVKFIKNGKVVSHWAKAYRGLMLRELAKYPPSSLKEFEQINFQNLKINSIKESKFKKEYIFDICE